jgi:hypothetical protein
MQQRSPLGYSFFIKEESFTGVYGSFFSSSTVERFARPLWACNSVTETSDMELITPREHQPAGTQLSL